MRFTISAPLIWKGYSINTIKKNELDIAKRLLIDQKKFVKAYNSENYVDLLKSGEVWIFYGYSGDIIQSIPENTNLNFIIPESGAVIYIDNVCVPVTCNEYELAHKFINYLLNPEVAAKIINATWFALPNIKARKMVKDEIRNHPGVYPSKDIIDKCESLEDIGQNISLYENIWRKLKSS